MEIEEQTSDRQEEFVQLLTQSQSRIYGFMLKLLEEFSRVADVFFRRPTWSCGESVQNSTFRINSWPGLLRSHAIKSG